MPLPLEQLSIIDIAEAIGVKSGGRRSGANEMYHCASPAHSDENASMGINEEEGVFKCYSCGVGGGKLGLVMLATGISSESEAAAHLVKLGLLSPAGPETAVAVRTPRAAAVRRSLASDVPVGQFDWVAAAEALRISPTAKDTWERRRVTVGAMREFGMGVVKYHDTMVFVLPMRDQSGEIIGRRLRPVTMDSVGSGWPVNKAGKVQKAITWGMPKTSEERDRNGLMIPVGFNPQAPETWIMEGEADGLAARSLARGQRLNVVATPGASLSGEIRRALRRVMAQSSVVIIAMHRDVPKRETDVPAGVSFVMDLLRLAGPSRCRVWIPPDGCDDFCDTIEKGKLPLSEGAFVSGEEFLTERGVPVHTLMAMQATDPFIPCPGRGLELLRGERSTLICNYDLRVLETWQCWGPDSQIPESMLLVEIRSMVGDLVATTRVTQREWLDTRTMLERIHVAFPKALEREMNDRVFQELRVRAMQRGRPVDKIVVSKAGWDRDCIKFPSCVVLGDGTCLGRSNVELPPDILHDWNMPGDDHSELLRLMVSLSRLAPSDEINSVLMSQHLIAGLSGAISAARLPIPNPWVYVWGPSRVGKSWTARCHAMVHTPMFAARGEGGALSVAGASAKSVEKILCHLDSTIMLIDDWNPNNINPNAMIDWTRMFHALFDAAGTQRLTRTRQLMSTRASGCALLVTGEDLPRDPSTANRFVVIGQHQKNDSIEDFWAVQEGEAILRTMMPALISGAVSLFGGFQGTLAEMKRLYFEAMLGYKGTMEPGRLLDRLSALRASLAMTRRVCEEFLLPRSPGADAGAMRAMFTRLEAGFDEAVSHMNDPDSAGHELSPETHFGHAARSMIDSNRLPADCLNSMSGDEPLLWPTTRGTLAVMLPAVIDAVRDHTRRVGQAIQFSNRSIIAHLRSAGLLAGTSVSNGRTKVVQPKSGRRVWATEMQPETFGYTQQEIVDLMGYQSEPLPGETKAEAIQNEFL